MGVSKKTRFEVFKRDLFTCQYCGRRPPDVMLECDHIVPKADGGADDMANLTTACFDCNRGKSDRPLDEVAPAVDEMQVLGAVQEMMERQATIRGQIRLEREFDETLDDAVSFLVEKWYQEFPWKPHFNDRAIRSFLRTLDLSDVSSAMDIAIAWRRQQEDNKSHVDVFRYMCGVMRNMTKEKEGGGRQ